MVFYEAPHKLKTTLDDLYGAFGNRRIALVRELTKLHEEVIRTTLSAAVTLYDEQPPRGEFVVIVEGKAPEKAVAATPESAAALARALIERDGLSASEAAKRAAALTGCKKGDIYKLI